MIYYLACFEFPWDIKKSLEFAFFRTFAVPSISKLLYSTGEFINRPQKRHDDTELILYEIMENGFESHQGAAALKRLNQMHGMFDISNEDFLYVLSTFIYEPVRWIERFGWRKLTENEKIAIFCFFQQLGNRMNINNIPPDFLEFETFNIQFEKKYFRYSPENQKIAESLRSLFLSFYFPKFLHHVSESFVNAMMDDHLLKACGLSTAAKGKKKFMELLLKKRGGFVRLMPKRNSPFLGTQVKRTTYPDGYKINLLGTFKKDVQNTKMKN